ncbi:MAG: hypothetical protein JXP73_00045 [Deltaproteobacteria bacterium]|nr:hypothetical protein [Deltaproteobacteria bacterium]
MRSFRGRVGVLGATLVVLTCTGTAAARAEVEAPPPLPLAPPPAPPQPLPARPAATMPPAAPAPAPVKYERYGLQILAADAISLGLCIGAIAVNSRSASSLLFVGGLISWLVLPPTVHGLHRNPKAALGSYLARLLIPPVTMVMLLAATNPSCDDGDCGEIAAVAGMGLLVSVTSVAFIDAVFWARTPVPAPPLSVAIVPYRDGAGLALGARF